jgi:hypothetical protein
LIIYVSGVRWDQKNLKHGHENNSGRIKFDISGQHRFGSIDQEERCEADRAIWGSAQAPEY